MTVGSERDGGRWGRRLVGALGAMFLLAAASPAAQAQSADPAVGPQPGGFGFDVAAGVALPAGALSTMTEAGASVHGVVTYHVGRRWGVWFDADTQWLNGVTDDSGVEWPDFRMIHAAVGGELNVFGGYDLRDDPRPDPFITTFRLGLGMTDFSTKETLSGGAPAPASFNPTNVSFRGGLTAGYQAASWVKVYAGSDVHFTLIDRADSAVLAAVSPEVTAFDKTWTIPIRVGVRMTTR